MKKDTHLDDLLSRHIKHSESLQKIVEDAQLEKINLLKKIEEEENEDASNTTFGQKAADAIAKFGGSWRFLISFFIVTCSWMVYNLHAGKHAFDTYPFILLNLTLSCLAAVQAPIILMSQNRKETRDEKRARNDYLIDLQAELENRAADRKFDLFLNSHFKELVEIQQIQIEKLDLLNKNLMKKLSNQNQDE